MVSNILLVGTVVLAASTLGLAIVGGIGTEERTLADAMVGMNRTTITPNGFRNRMH